MKNRLIPLLILPAALLLVVVFGYPVVWLLMRSFSDPQWGLQNFEVLLTRPVYLKTLWNTVAISGTVTLVCAVLGYPLAYSMANGSELTKRLLLFAVLIPFWTSILVRAFAWVVLLQRQGLVNAIMINLGIISDPLVMLHNRTGTLIGMVQVLLPFMVLPLYSVMLRVDGRLLQAASVLGANPFRVFVRVYLPLTMPGLLAGATLVFLIALGYYITPALLGGPQDMMIAQLIQQQVSSFGNWGLAGALSVTLLVATGMVLIVMRYLFGVRQLWSR